MKVGLQSNIFSEEMHRAHFGDMLKTIKESGYDGFEIGVQRVDTDKAADFARLVGDSGLQTTAIHTHLRLDDSDWLADTERYIQEAANFTAAVGAPYMPMSGKWMEKTDEQLSTMVTLLNRFGEVATAAGLRFCYHHHDWEFADNGREMTFLMANTDPNHVGILCDIGWIIKAGQSVSEMIDTYGDRIVYFHVKDAPTAARESWFTELGRGIVPLAQFVAKLDVVQPEWLMVERDEAVADGVASARESRDYLKHSFNI